MRNVTILLAVVAMLALAAPAFAQTHSWDGTIDGESWDIGGNWGGSAAGTLPGTGSTVFINGGTSTEANPVLIKSGVNAITKKLIVGIYGGHPGYLTVKDGGSLEVLGWEFNIAHATGTTTDFSILTQEGGAVIAKGFDLHIGVAGSKGRYAISGGKIGSSTTISKTLDMTGGVGELIVDCSDDATAGAVVVSLIRVAGYKQNATSGLEFKLDADGDVCPITVEGNVELAGTLALTGTRTSTDPLVLMTYTGTLSTAFDTEPAGWTMSYDNGQVTATIPEPATMVLLGIGGIGVLIRRRRK